MVTVNYYLEPQIVPARRWVSTPLQRRLVMVTGIVNPHGPTLMGLVTEYHPSRPNEQLTWFSLNPFSSTVRVLGFIRQDRSSSNLADHFLASQRRLRLLAYEGTGCFTLAWHGHLLSDGDARRRLLGAILTQCVGVPSQLVLLRQYPNNPWKRIKAEIEAASAAALIRSKDKSLLNLFRIPRKAEPELELELERPPTGAEINEYLTIVEAEAHQREEMKALVAAWDGAIEHSQLSPGTDLDVLPTDEMTDFLHELLTGDRIATTVGSDDIKETSESPSRDVSAIREVFRKYGGQNDRQLIPELIATYGKLLKNTAPDVRQALYDDLMTKVERGVLKVNVLLPFLVAEPEGMIVSRAAIDYASLCPLQDGDPMTAVKQMCAMLASSSVENPGALFGGMLCLGDRRVTELLWLTRLHLTHSHLDQLSRVRTGSLSAATVEFLLDWMEESLERDDEHKFGQLCAALVNQRKALSNGLIMTGERTFPATDADPAQFRARARLIPIDVFTTEIAPRMREIAVMEPAPQVMPMVLDAWHI